MRKAEHLTRGDSAAVRQQTSRESPGLVAHTQELEEAVSVLQGVVEGGNGPPWRRTERQPVETARQSQRRVPQVASRARTQHVETEEQRLIPVCVNRRAREGLTPHGPRGAQRAQETKAKTRQPAAPPHPRGA